MAIIETPVILFATILVIYLAIKQYQARQQKIDRVLIESLERITNSLDEGNTMETALTQLANDPTHQAAHLFKKILKHIEKDANLPQALEHAAQNAQTKTFAYVCTLLYTAEQSKGNVSQSIKQLTNKLWQIQHLQETINSKTQTPILIIQALGIFILPAIYYFLAAILQTETLDTVALVSGTILTAYLVATGIIITFLDWFVFRNAQESIMLLPVTISYQYLFLTTIAPIILSSFGGMI